MKIIKRFVNFLFTIVICLFLYGVLWDSNFFSNIEKSIDNSLVYKEKLKKTTYENKDGVVVVLEEFFIPLAEFRVKDFYICNKNNYCINLKNNNKQYGVIEKNIDGYKYFSISYSQDKKEIEELYFLSYSNKNLADIIEKENKSILYK